jgi:hypothetical protein
MNLRKEARGRECQIRIPGCCNGNPETTCLAHYRLAGISGMGIKPPDLIGAWACSACHNYVDTHNDLETKLAFAHGVFRTQTILHKEEKL